MMVLPPTSANHLLQHILWAHLQVMLWKAANYEGPLGESRDITNFGWEFQDKISKAIAEVDHAPQELLDVIQCQCKARSVLLRHVDTTSSTCHARHSATVMVDRIA